MKKFIFIFIFLSSFVFIQAQEVLRLRCNLVSIADYNSYREDFNEFSSPTNTNILITISERKVIIYSEHTQDISIITKSPKQYTVNNGTPYIELTCVDDAGKRCNITLFIYGRVIDVLLRYSNVMISYTCNIE